MRADICFETLVKAVGACRKCSRMNDVARVLSWANGPLPAKIMFIGEAPGRLGADQTGVPFHGDVAGRNFELLLASSGMSRNEVFVTNAVACNPRKSDGTNDTPSSQEIRNCADHLRTQIEIVQPAVVASLGARALEALAHIEPHGLTLSDDVRTSHRWFGRILVPLYHPGQRAMVHRNFHNQLSDYYFVARLAFGRKKKRPILSPESRIAPELSWLVSRTLSTHHELSLFALHKIVYLFEYEFLRLNGRRFTSLFLIRQKEGPYCTDLASALTRPDRVGAEVIFRQGKPFVRAAGSQASLFEASQVRPTNPDAEELLARILARVRGLSDARLKMMTYRTPPMRELLKQERSGRYCLNRPLLVAARA